MNIDDLPMNEPVKFGEDEHTSTMFTRVEKDKVVAQYVNIASGDEVAKFYLWEDGNAELVNFDTTYWNCLVNDRPFSKNDVNDIFGRKLKSVRIDVKDRQFHVGI